jgi:hypothetical protein
MTRSLLRLPSYPPAIALTLASGVSAAASPAFAQGVHFTASDFRSLYASVESRGIDRPMPWNAASILGVRVPNALPCRQVSIGGQGAADSPNRSIVSLQYKSHQYLAFFLRSRNDHWIFLIDDAGKFIVASHAVVRDGWHTLTPSEAQPLVAAEEAFWRNWIVDWPLP